MAGVDDNSALNIGKDNITDKAVTGGVTDITSNSAKILGYVNIDASSIPLAKYGVELFSLTPTDGFPTEESREIIANDLAGGRSFSVTTSNLRENTIYYYRTFLKLDDGSNNTYYGTMLYFMSNCPNNNHPHEIDLGYNVKWACCNVGAKEPCEFGSYYAWGETSPKSTYSWQSYKFFNSDFYSNENNRTTLETSDDAARANWGGTWRMPTSQEMNNLFDETLDAKLKKDYQEKINTIQWKVGTWTNYNGVNGIIFIGQNGKCIFLPAAGCMFNGQFDEVLNNGKGSDGYYWTSSLHSNDNNYARNIYFYYAEHISPSFSRCLGLSVRPVKE